MPASATQAVASKCVENRKSNNAAPHNFSMGRAAILNSPRGFKVTTCIVQFLWFAMQLLQSF
jgi:hypothetical protein